MLSTKQRKTTKEALERYQSLSKKENNIVMNHRKIS